MMLERLLQTSMAEPVEHSPITVSSRPGILPSTPVAAPIVANGHAVFDEMDYTFGDEHQS